MLDTSQKATDYQTFRNNYRGQVLFLGHANGELSTQTKILKDQYDCIIVKPK